MPVGPEISLRERKKQKTRETIVSEALKLFAENGYQQTTIAQIAEAADVSPRTVSTYFPAKEELVFGLNGDMKERLARAIHCRAPGQNTMEALRAWILNERAFWEQHEDQLNCQRLVIDGDEGLIAHERALIRGFEVLLVEGLAVDLGKEPDDLEPRMAGAAAVAVFDMLSEEKRPEKVELRAVEEQMKIFDQALAFITAGVEALRQTGDS